MHKYAGLMLAITSSFASAEAVQRGQVYSELDAMYFSSPGDFDGEQTMGLSFGYSFNNQHAIEAEIQVNGLDSEEYGFEADADLFTYLAGYRYNIERDNKFTYFVGGGVGYSRAEFYTALDVRAKQDVTVGFVRAGVDYDFSENAYVSGEIRYQNFSDLNKNDVKYDIGGVPVAGVSLGYRF